MSFYGIGYCYPLSKLAADLEHAKAGTYYAYHASTDDMVPEFTRIMSTHATAADARAAAETAITGAGGQWHRDTLA